MPTPPGTATELTVQAAKDISAGMDLLLGCDRVTLQERSLEDFGALPGKPFRRGLGIPNGKGLSDSARHPTKVLCLQASQPVAVKLSPDQIGEPGTLWVFAGHALRRCQVFRRLFSLLVLRA